MKSNEREQPLHILYHHLHCLLVLHNAPSQELLTIGSLDFSTYGVETWEYNSLLDSHSAFGFLLVPSHVIAPNIYRYLLES